MLNRLKEYNLFLDEVVLSDEAGYLSLVREGESS
jgi:hypothetical protein